MTNHKLFEILWIKSPMLSPMIKSIEVNSKFSAVEVEQRVTPNSGFHQGTISINWESEND